MAEVPGARVAPLLTVGADLAAAHNRAAGVAVERRRSACRAHLIQLTRAVNDAAERLFFTS